MPTLPPTLRPYQREIIQAIAASALNKRELSFSVKLSRQAGKNEISAQLQLMLLLAHVDRGGTIVKTAPTYSPQLQVSHDRLSQLIDKAGMKNLARAKGNTIWLGRARVVFLSGQPDANVVGNTASILLEVDEAQDYDQEKFDKDFKPMVLATGATIVYYGTAWGPDSLLEQAREHHLRLQAEDGIRRHWELDYDTIGRSFPEYRRRAQAERDRLGAQSVTWLTQYRLVCIAGAGRLFTREQLDRCRGDHAEWPAGEVDEAASPSIVHVAGLDIAGSRGSLHADRTVLTIARVTFSTDPAELPMLHVVKHRAWQGVAGEDVVAEVLRLHQRYRFRRLSVDATGLGDHVAAALSSRLGDDVVEHVVFTSAMKSELGYRLVAQVEAGKVKMYAAPGDHEHAALFWDELRLARVNYSEPKPDRQVRALMNFSVPDSAGHDDYLMSVALMVHAARDAQPRLAIGRSYR